MEERHLHLRSVNDASFEIFDPSTEIVHYRIATKKRKKSWFQRTTTVEVHTGGVLLATFEGEQVTFEERSMRLDDFVLPHSLTR